MSNYTKVTEYLFEADSEMWAITEWGTRDSGEPVVRVKETICNGQEDTHMYGVFVKGKNGWKVDKLEGCNIDDYSSESTVEEIIEFLDENDPVNEEWWSHE